MYLNYDYLRVERLSLPKGEIKTQKPPEGGFVFLRPQRDPFRFAPRTASLFEQQSGFESKGRKKTSTPKGAEVFVCVHNRPMAEH